MPFIRTAFSIRKKITYSFYALLAVVVGTALLTYGIVWKVEQRVEQLGLVDDFFNLTLELRRFEKNFFLYEQEKDYEENLSYGRRLVLLLEENRSTFGSLMPAARVELAANTLGRYNDFMQRLHPLKGSPESSRERRQWLEFQDQLRTTGKELTDFAEKIGRTQKSQIHTLLRTTRVVLVASICGLVVLSVAMATFLAGRVVQSLKLLEDYTRSVSQGELPELPMHGGEKEIDAIIQAFKRMTHELQIRQKQLVQSEKLAALGTLLAGVAHELNNPLSNISTSAQILAEEIEEDNLEFKKSLVTQIDEQADKARDIVRTLLEFSRSQVFEKKELPLLKLVTDTIRLIRGQVPSMVDVRVEIPEDLAIFADKQRIQQVFLNLIKNAIDAVDENGHIWITARRLESGGTKREVEIMIEDDGPGIPPEDARRIFDPFFTTKDVGKGSGLGLFIAHDIIESHGGSITVDSHPGSGTTFIIWLADEQR